MEAGLALLTGIRKHLDQYRAEDDDAYFEAWEDMAARLGFNATDAKGNYHDPLSDLLKVYRKNPEQAAQQLIKHVQRQSINPAKVKASFRPRDDWRYHARKNREEPELTGGYNNRPKSSIEKSVPNVASAPGTLARAATVAKAGIDKLSNLGKNIGLGQQVKATPALSAPTRPEVELPVNAKQKQKVGQEVAEATTVERDGITLDYQFGANQQKLKITASSNGRRLGSAVFQNYGPADRPEFKGDQVEVDERYRGQGIATVMYNFARELVGKIYPSPAQTQDGERFWKGKPVWEQELNEFDPGEGGFGPFKVYYEQDYFIGQFPTYEEAKGEVDFLRDSDPKSATHHWRIVDGTGETVWEYDIGDDIDAWRRGQKFQKRP
jgi:GNAT superfamily N-acetyltransferase